MDRDVPPRQLFIQAIFTPLTADTGPTRYAIDEFGFVLPAVIIITAVFFWRRRSVALVEWERGVDAPANTSVTLTA